MSLIWPSSPPDSATPSPAPRPTLPTCPDWTADDLLWHLGWVQSWWTVIVRQNLTGPEARELMPDRPAGRSQLLEFYRQRWWPNDRTRLFGEIGWHHRTLSTILSCFLEAGFTLDGAEEPRAPADVTAESPWYDEVAEVLTLRWRLLDR